MFELLRIGEAALASGAGTSAADAGEGAGTRHGPSGRSLRVDVLVGQTLDLEEHGDNRAHHDKEAQAAADESVAGTGCTDSGGEGHDREGHGENENKSKGASHGRSSELICANRDRF
jgi:hypothetical protein